MTDRITAYIDKNNGLQEIIDNAINISWSQEREPAHFEELAKSAEILGKAFLDIGFRNFEKVQLDPSPTYKNYYVCFEWMEQAKGFMLLWRDILFQEQKAWLKLSARETELSNYQELKEESRKLLYNAAGELHQLLQTNEPVDAEKIIEKWKLQDNPWPTYKEQIEAIPEQCHGLVKQSDLLWNASGNYVLIHSHFKDFYDVNIKNIEELKMDLKDLLQKQEKEELEGSQIVTHLEELKKKYSYPNSTTNFTNTLDEYLTKLPHKEKICVDTMQGMLLFKEIDLHKETRFWLTSELLPDVHKLGTIQESITNKINLSIVNIKNRIGVEQEDGEAPLNDELEKILANFLKSLDKSRDSMQTIKVQSNEQLGQNFSLINIYGENFLARSLQQTINQYRDYQLKNWEFIRNWFSDKFAVFRRFQQNVRTEEALSISEKMVRAVRSRTPQADNSHYTSMFLTKGWVGDSFTIGRTAELAQVTNLIENWRLGFRGAITITGQRFSGKTLFGEIVSQRFTDTVIKLKPNQKIRFAGRFFEVQHDLGAALEFITKYSLGTPIMIWIDDLELWQDDKISLSDNVRSLLDTIDITSGRIFFMVSLSNWLDKHLDKIFEMNKVFQSEINMDRMEANEISEAIYIRHSATHMELIDEEKEEVTANEIRKMINRIYRNSDGNIGEAIQQWAYAVKKYNEENVVFNKTTHYKIPEFMSIDSALLLKTIMMDKQTNEYRLRKLFGPAFKSHYKIILQRLFHLGILKRNGNWLEVNPFIVNDIGRILESKIDFSFQENKLSKEKTKL